MLAKQYFRNVESKSQTQIASVCCLLNQVSDGSAQKIGGFLTVSIRALAYVHEATHMAGTS